LIILYLFLLSFYMKKSSHSKFYQHIYISWWYTEKQCYLLLRTKTALVRHTQKGNSPQQVVPFAVYVVSNELSILLSS